jgi:hypothetical protein
VRCGLTKLLEHFFWGWWEILGTFFFLGNFARGHLSILIFAARHSSIEPLLMDTLKLWILAAGHHTY